VINCGDCKTEQVDDAIRCRKEEEIKERAEQREAMKLKVKME
jgi:hypothetical protein